MMLIAYYLYFFVLVYQCFGQNSECEISLSDKGLNFAAEVAMNILSRDLLTKTIPEMSGSGATASNIRITEFTKPGSNVRLNAGVGLTLSLSGASISAEGNWRYEKKVLFIKIRDSGTFTASSNVGISVSVRIGRNNRNPTIEAYDCSASLSNLSIKTRGSWISFVYNFLISLFKGTIRSRLESVICDAALKAINVNGVGQLATLNLEATVNRYLTVDYSLTKNPYFSSTFFKSYHKGTFVGDGVVYQTPVMNTPTDKMIGFSISENVFNSAINVLYNKGLANYSFTFKDWNEIAEIFRLDADHGSGPYEVNIYANALPTVMIAASYIRVRISGVVDILSKPPGQASKSIASLRFILIAEATASIDSNILKGTIISITPESVTISPPFPDVSDSTLNEGIREFMKLILPSINEEMGKGLPLPSVLGVSFIDSNLVFRDRYLSASANVRYSG